MRVLILSAKDDNGGIGIAIKRAFDKHSKDIEVRSVTRERNWIGWEEDIYWPHGERLDASLQWMAKGADVIHVMDVFAAVEPFDVPDKPKVFHHHGVDFKADADRLMARCRAEGIKQIVATHDLLRYGDDLEWLPNPCNIDLLQEIAAPVYKDSLIRLVQSPAGREKNGTEGLLAAIDQLPVTTQLLMELDIIEGVPWRDCMKRKARGDVMFDSLDVGYGISTLEAWGLNLPVIHGGDQQVEDAVIETMGYTPYYHATRDTLSDAINLMVLDPELRYEYVEKGWQAVNDFHSEQAVVKNLTRIYEEAMG